MTVGHDFLIVEAWHKLRIFSSPKPGLKLKITSTLPKSDYRSNSAQKLFSTQLRIAL